MSAAITAEIQALKEAVAAERTVTDSAVALLNGLTAKIVEIQAAIADDPANVSQLADLVASLNAEKQSLSDAVVANTPPAP